MRNSLSAFPRLFFANKIVLYSPSLSILPVIIPVFGSRVNPSGRPFAEKIIGLLPVAAIV
jgi:hypothetical protein